MMYIRGIVGKYMKWAFKSYFLSIWFSIYIHIAGFYCSKKSCLAAAAAKQHMRNRLWPNLHPTLRFLDGQPPTGPQV